ncbi:MAG: magnesium chelatase, partial [Bacillota bacterium]|nr:magnesium chelatase [Bacillota bacterium]
MHWNNVIFHTGNEELKRFIDIGILAANLEIPVHFHVEGVRGTGKTTLIRAAKSRLPEIKKVRGCIYNCKPQGPHCPDHSGSVDCKTETGDMPFLEISHSAKVGTVIGSIDLEKLTSVDSPAAALLPGTLPRANRGIVFVDEINRLADTSPALVDVLLDAMGTKPGRVQIEETGLPTVEMPLNVSVWAASNPDEEPGPLQEIRRQLADRFDFVVRIERPQDCETVRAIMNAADLQQENISYAVPCIKDFNSVILEDSVEEFLSQLYIRFRLESIRGIQAARLGALLHAVGQGKNTADFSDLAAVLPAALRHRVEAPKLLEITEAMHQAAQAGKRRLEKTPPANIKGLTKDKLPYRYPALWRGLWQRLTRQQKSGVGKKVAVQTADLTKAGGDPSAEKKTKPGLK